MKAIVFVDVQNDFIKGGKLAYSYPIEDNVQKIVEFAKECKAAGDKLYATRDTHDRTEYEDVGTIVKFDEYGRVDSTKTINGRPIAGYFATLEGQKLPVEHCIEGDDGWMVDNRLMDVLNGACTFINKPTFGSYDLVDVISEDFENEEPEEIVVCGYDLSVCVMANAVLLRAKYPNVKITIRADLCGDVDKTAFDAAIKVFQMQQIDVKVA